MGKTGRYHVLIKIIPLNFSMKYVQRAMAIR